MIPYLLQNSLVEDSALSLAKNLPVTEDIWKREKGACGDSKFSLKEKLSEVSGGVSIK